jgi:hypothetical protein
MTAAQQHRYEAWASSTLYFAFAVSLVRDIVFRGGYFAAHATPRDYFLLYVANPFLLYLYYQIRRGVASAKKISLFLYALFLLEIAHGELASSSYDTSLEVASLVVQHGLQLGACLLMLLSLQKPAALSAKA